MNAFTLTSLLAALMATSSAVVILAGDSRQPASRTASLLIGGVAWWACCDVVRSVALEPAATLVALKAGAPGWCFIGPLSLDLAARLHSAPPRLLARLRPLSYAGGFGFLAIAWATPWMFESAGPRWQVELGPAAIAITLYALAHVVPAIWLGVAVIRRSPSPSDRAQASWLAAGMLLPLLIIPTTNVILPLAGVPTFPLGNLTFALFGAVVAGFASRHGSSPMARGHWLRQILDAHPDGVALVLLDGRIGLASGALGRLVGVPAAALQGRPIDALLDRALVAPPIEVQELEASLRTEAGHSIPVSVSTRILRDRRQLDFALVVVIRDLREVVALRDRLVTSGRLAAIGQLAAGIAHEINNPMAFVRANLSLLRGHLERLGKGMDGEAERRALAGEGEELLAESLEGVERACAIVRDINGFSHAGSDARAPVDLAALLENVLRVAAPHLGRGIAVERDFRDAPPALGASQELKQVFLNLLLNAAHACRGRGRIRIELAADGPQVVVSVRDDGCGIPPDAMEKIFDPFFTTKPVGEGTGMGLFLSYQIVRRHGGEIRVDSAPGRGTSVRVALPSARG
jgi:signal transduction histidine kinase